MSAHREKPGRIRRVQVCYAFPVDFVEALEEYCRYAGAARVQVLELAGRQFLAREAERIARQDASLVVNQSIHRIEAVEGVGE